jgi:hypothetical protein
VLLIFFKCCVPKAGDRELARVIHHLTGHQLHHLTVKSLCERFFFWRHSEFQQLIRYPVPTDPQALRLEMVRLSQQGWTEVRIAELLRINRKTVRKWLRRAQQQSSPHGDLQLPLMELSRCRTFLRAFSPIERPQFALASFHTHRRLTKRRRPIAACIGLTRQDLPPGDSAIRTQT